MAITLEFNKESLSKFDDGRVDALMKVYDKKGTPSYKALLNIYPYLPINIEESTFNEWLQFCEDGVRDQKYENYITYKAKHWSKL